MTERTYNVLFLCTGNSARSILAEGILRKDGAGRFMAYSAGSQPKGTVNPLALRVLEAHGYPTDGYRSKSWDEFAAPGAPVMDFVINRSRPHQGLLLRQHRRPCPRSEMGLGRVSLLAAEPVRGLCSP